MVVWNMYFVRCRRVDGVVKSTQFEYVALYRDMHPIEIYVAHNIPIKALIYLHATNEMT